METSYNIALRNNNTDKKDGHLVRKWETKEAENTQQAMVREGDCKTQKLHRKACGYCPSRSQRQLEKNERRRKFSERRGKESGNGQTEPSSLSGLCLLVGWLDSVSQSELNSVDTVGSEEREWKVLRKEERKALWVIERKAVGYIKPCGGDDLTVSDSPSRRDGNMKCDMKRF